MFERPNSGERAVLVHVSLGGAPDPEAMQEFRELVRSAGAEPLALIVAQRPVPDPRLYVGRGKADAPAPSPRPLPTRCASRSNSWVRNW